MDEVVRRLAERQHGVVARWQLLEIGVGQRAIERRLDRGRLALIHSDVYAVGHSALRPEAVALAGVMSAWPHSAASHWTSTWFHLLVENAPTRVDVTAAKSRRPRRGLVIHRAVLPATDITVIRGIPCTSVARTLLDLSGVVSEQRLRRLVKRAEFRRGVTTDELRDVLARHPRRRGRQTLARIVDDRVLSGRPTRSEMEDRFLEFCARRGLPLPETNVELEIRGRKLEVDCVWRHERVALELDGRQAHATETAFETDRARDRILLAAGWAPARATWTQLHREGDSLEADLRAILANRSRFTPRMRV